MLAAAAQTDSKKEAKALLEKAAKEPLIRHWSLLQLGRHLKEAGNAEEAKKTLKKVDNSSAAWIESELLLLELDPMRELPLAPKQLKSLLSRSRRSDLHPSLLWVLAQKKRTKGEDATAFHKFQELRKQYPDSEYASKAREAMTQIATKDPSLQTLAESFIEVDLLKREKEYELALEKLERIIDSVTPTADSYYQALLTKVDLLRRTKQNSVADNLLGVISTDAPGELSGKALLIRAKNLWNVNKHKEALRLIDLIQKRGATSALKNESLYIQGRIFEELDSTSSAEDSYKSLLRRKPAQGLKLKTLRQLAWLYFRNKQLEKAVPTFSELRKDIVKQLALDSDSPARRFELEELKYHANYWMLVAQARLSRNQAQYNSLSKTFRSKEFQEKLREELQHASYPQYYSSKLNLQQKDVSEHSESQCPVPLSKKLALLLSRLTEAGLYDFARHEINWLFVAQSSGDSDDNESIDRVRRILLLSKYAKPMQSIREAEWYLIDAAPESVPKDCRARIHDAAFPKPYLEMFENASKQTSVPMDLLLAISRTESHFDPQARSVKDAQGLMQLLPSTAKAEGMSDDQDLFDPQLNIELGSKHFSGLLKQYDSKEYAIAAYNAGATAVERWRSRYPDLSAEEWVEMIAYPETKKYVKKVLTASQQYKTP